MPYTCNLFNISLIQTRAASKRSKWFIKRLSSSGTQLFEWKVSPSMSITLRRSSRMTLWTSLVVLEASSAAEPSKQFVSRPSFTAPSRRACRSSIPFHNLREHDADGPPKLTSWKFSLRNAISSFESKYKLPMETLIAPSIGLT